MKHYHYILSGGGAAGLLLAYRMAMDAFFDDKRILIIEEKPKIKNDRTWCFWEKPGGELDALLFKTWEQAIFKSPTVYRRFSMQPYRYKMLRSGDLYRFIQEKIAATPHIEIVYDRVKSIHNRGEGVEVETETTVFTANKVFNSILNNADLYKQKKYPVLQQHFRGWFIQTEQAIFDEQALTFMDFTVPQQGNTRFMYVLPFSPTEALVEYTLFSETLLPEKDYEEALQAYIKELGVESYKIVEKEKGSIPMTGYNFGKRNSAHIHHIGTAGGWTKPSTGYTFLNMVRQTKELVTRLKQELPLSAQAQKWRFRWYDRLFIDVLHRRNELGGALFLALFKKNPPRRIFRFLGEQTTIKEEWKLLSSLPARLFIKSLFRRWMNRFK